jgi:hypothetical protein
MKNEFVKKTFGVSLVICLMLVLLPAAAFAWDWATHAYIEEHFYKMQGQADEGVLQNRIYGATALDLFNNNFTLPYFAFFTYLHDRTHDNFLKAWENAATGSERAFAYGFVGHNNTWGMDSTAHISGVTYGRGEGYVIAKAHELAVMLKPGLESQLGPLPDDVLVNICHYFVEAGVEFLVRDLDPSIGNKLIAAAFYRSDEVPALLSRTYAADFAALAGSPENAAQIITTAESKFRLAYGLRVGPTQDNARPDCRLACQNRGKLSRTSGRVGSSTHPGRQTGDRSSHDSLCA